MMFYFESDSECKQNNDHISTEIEEEYPSIENPLLAHQHSLSSSSSITDILLLHYFPSPKLDVSAAKGRKKEQINAS